MQGIIKLLKVMNTLRAENGCPWDKKQTLETLTSYTLEETYELIDAIISSDKEHIEEELGDILFQVVFYAKIAEEEGWSSFDEISFKTAKKMEQRHPHVFADAVWDTEQQRLEGWEKIKRQQKKQRHISNKQTTEPVLMVDSVLQDIPKNLPALLKAKKMQKKAASVGFDWPNYYFVLKKVDEELAELKEAIDDEDKTHIEEELGDLLFSLVNLGRHLKVDPEIALEKCNLKFKNRFYYIEKKLSENGKCLEDSSLDEMERFWQEAKTIK